MTKKNNDACCCLRPVQFGIAMALLWLASVWLLGITAMINGYGAGFVNALGSLYIGYEASFLGLLKGGLWALADGFVGGFLLIWLYNWLCCKCKCCRF